MSNTGAEINKYQWQPFNTTEDAAAPLQSQAEDAGSVGNSQAHGSPAAEQSQRPRPPLRSHKSFPYSLGPSSRSWADNSRENSSTGAPEELTERILSQGPQPTDSANLQQPTFGGSAPTSPVAELTPHSPRVKDSDEPMEDEEIDFDNAEQEDEDDRPPMTAAELRAHKRKMKRFR